MKRIYLFCLLSLSALFSCTQKPKEPASFNIVPKPVTITAGNAWITWDNDVTLIAVTPNEKSVAAVLQDFLKTKKIKATVAEFANTTDEHVSFFTVTDSLLGNEGYKLSINEKGVSISANTGAGLFYGVQSLFQLLPASSNKIELPFVDIQDQPRFQWRGLHLDVARHFFPVDFIKKYIDAMAHFKLNTFHWHLTEDQGWRIEIKKYPKLQEIAAFRNETVIGHASTKKRNGPATYDGKRHGGFYTQDEVREVVAYAAQRFITIVPEIEMPGHALAALTAYPHLGCTGGPYEVATTWGVFTDVFCAGKETTFQFLQDVLDEVVPLFPGTYIHIGGDECPKDNWKKCPHCQKRMKTEKLNDEHQLQSYFIQRIEKHLNAKGKRIIGWDEILEGGLAPNAAVMSWRGEEGGIAAAQQNHDVVMTPTSWLYLDYYQDTAKTEPLAIGGFVPLSKVYSYEPLPSQLTAEQAKHILGVQANVWSEYMPDGKQVEYMVYPRAIALAEVAWSSKENKNYDDFVKRLRTNQHLLDDWKINYGKHIFIATKKDTTK
jgi:hexosaminidase